MANTYPITPEQLRLLSSFTCERLTDNPDNLFQIQEFHSENGQGLVNSLRNQGWNSDRRGDTAYYLIKNPDGEIVMFFSLKCGVLFDPDYALTYLEAFKEAMERDNAAAQWLRLMDGDPAANRYFRNLAGQMGPGKFDAFVESLRIKTDKKQEPNQKIIRVSEARPAIELVEFCANDATKGCWRQYGFPSHRKLGETMFWWFIVPKMLEINALVGCEYVYLFAADKTVSGSLSSYYRERLHFSNIPHLGTIKPSYDLNCFFMGSRLRTRTGLPQPVRRQIPPEELWGLDHYKDAYFDNFNLNPDADDLV